MAKYFDKKILDEMNEARKNIFAERGAIYKKHKVDILDTDALSALSIFEIVTQYDTDYNINFARNGEDAKSNGVLIEQKATRVEGGFTKTGKPRKHAGTDAAFQFHAMGDIDSNRYLFVARNKDDLSIMRIYDISNEHNRKIVLDHLMAERNAWLEKSMGDQTKMKRDIITLTEKVILEKLNFSSKTIINGCCVFTDHPV
jgi:hypothetical protein